MYLEISNPMDYQAGLYIRLSKEDENEGPSESVNNQKSLLDEFTKEHRLSVYDTYIDDGFSGTNFDRPAFRRMIDDINAKKVNMVITKDLSRLGRDYIKTGQYIELYFPKNRVRYLSLLDGIDTGVESTANDITPFRAIMNDMYAKDISKKITSVKRDKQRRGLFIGGKASYGYKISKEHKNTIEVDPPAAEIVHKLFSLALEGKSCHEIAVILNNEGVPTPSQYAKLTPGKKGPYSGKWSSERVTFMLKNELYMGNMVQGRIRKINYKIDACRKLPPEEWTVVEGTHEPIVNEEAFHKVQLMISSRYNTRSRIYDFLLKGLIYCHECGYPLAVINRPNARGEDCLYFVCRTYQRFTKAGVCTCHSIKEETVTNAVLQKVQDMCEQYLHTEKLMPLAKQALEEARQAESHENRIAVLQRKIESLTAHLDKMYMDKLTGILDDKDFERIYLKVKEERSALEHKLSEIDTPDYSPDKQTETAKELVKRFVDTAYCSKDLLASLIERVELTENRQIIIHFRFRQLEAIS